MLTTAHGWSLASMDVLMLCLLQEVHGNMHSALSEKCIGNPITLTIFHHRIYKYFPFGTFSQVFPYVLVYINVLFSKVLQNVDF